MENKELYFTTGELARLTGGEQVTPAMLESAGELLDEAAAYKKKLAAG